MGPGRCPEAESLSRWPLRWPGLHTLLPTHPSCPRCSQGTHPHPGLRWPSSASPLPARHALTAPTASGGQPAGAQDHSARGDGDVTVHQQGTVTTPRESHQMMGSQNKHGAGVSNDLDAACGFPMGLHFLLYRERLWKWLPLRSFVAVTFHGCGHLWPLSPWGWASQHVNANPEWKPSAGPLLLSRPWGGFCWTQHLFQRNVLLKYYMHKERCNTMYPTSGIFTNERTHVIKTQLEKRTLPTPRVPSRLSPSLTPTWTTTS